MDLLDQQAIPHLPIRLDTDYPEKSARTFSKENLDLPHSPSQCLRVYAGEQRAVLLIDQLDAIRWTSRNSAKAWEICKEILDDALSSPEMSVVVVGRTMDFNDDPKIKHWKQELANNDAVSIEGFTVGALPEEEVAALVGNYGMNYASLLPREKEILYHVSQGFSNREIASALDISEKTIEFHLKSIFNKLEVTTRTEAVSMAFKSGWL
jgi:DNA-binding CsgD family transcriptional regulator